MQDDTKAENSEEEEPVTGEATDSAPEPTEEEAAQEPEVVESTSASVEEQATEEMHETPEPVDEPSPAGDVETAEAESESIFEAAAALETKSTAERVAEAAQEAVAPEELFAAVGSEEPSAAVAPDEPSAAAAPETPLAAVVPKSGDEEAEGSEEEEDVDERPVLIVPPPDDGIKRRWYAIHAHSGQEGNVQAALRVKAEQSGFQNMITNVFVPMEEVAEYKSGEKRLSKRKFFPGYVLVQLPEHPEKNADLWHLIKDTPGVTGFIGSRTEPVPLEDSEVLALAEEMRGERERPRPKVAYEIGERVKVIDGAFANFMGNIGEINEERAKMKVLIEIFERQTSVEVEFWQVEKI